MATHETTVAAVRALLDEFILTLDRREFDAWLALFTADGYYAVLREVELRKGNNVVLIGEDMKRLRGRVSSGVDRDLRRTVHMVSGLRVADDGGEASASFALWYDGISTYAGRYQFVLAGEGPALRLKHVTVVLDNEMIHQPIYLPI